MIFRRLLTALYNRVSDDEQPEEHDTVQLDASDGVIDNPLPGHEES